MEARNSSEVYLDEDTIKSDGLLQDSLVIDSLLMETIKSEELLQDSLVVDSLSTDTIKSEMLDSKVVARAIDSVIVSIVDSKIYYHGEAVIQYKDIEIKADLIVMAMDSSEITAIGVADTNGVVQGKPVFNLGPEEFEADQLRYNFETSKGIVTGIVTEQEGGFVQGGRTKIVNDSTSNMINGRYTTCDADHPHFYLQMTKGKVLPNKIITGPAYLVVEDIPLPVAIPFGFFPKTKTYSSGILLPTYGEETERGIYLRDMGYYWAASDYFDLTLRGDIYSRGSMGIKLSSNYKVKYKFNGSFSVKLYKNVYGEKGVTEGSDMYRTSNDFSVTWSHSQDSKANPTQSFSASVNLSTSSYDENNSNSASSYLTNTKSSSISYSKSWNSSPFSLSAALRHSQNSLDTTISLTLPQLSLSMSSIYPFKSSKRVGPERWSDKINLSYSMDMQNSISTHEDELMNSSFATDWKNGMKHKISTSTSFKLLDYISLSPSLSYNERWYLKKIYQDYDPEIDEVVSDTATVFTRSYDYSVSASLSTKIYGMFEMKNKDWRVKAIRHVITPSLSVSYRPDFGQTQYGMYGTYVDGDGEEVRYAYHEGSVYGTASEGRVGSIGFSLGNNLEMKVAKFETDSVSEDEDAFDKIAIFEQLNFSTSYNLAADSLNLSDITMSGRSTIRDISLNYSATFDPYSYDDSGNKINEFLASTGNGLAFMKNARLSFGMNFSSDKGKKEEEENKTPEEIEEENVKKQRLPGDVSDYVDFDMPWSFSFDYSFTYSKSNPTAEPTLSQVLDLSGDFSLTDKWKVGFSSGYDFEDKEVSYTQFSIDRDLHCWQMSFSMVPFGYRQSYSFTIRARSSLLQDLKLSKRASWYDNN